MQKQEQKAEQEATEAEKVVCLRLGYQKLDFGRKVFIKKEKALEKPLWKSGKVAHACAPDAPEEEAAGLLPV